MMLTIEHTDLDRWSKRRFPFLRYVADYDGAGATSVTCPLAAALDAIRGAVRMAECDRLTAGMPDRPRVLEPDGAAAAGVCDGEDAAAAQHEPPKEPTARRLDRPRKAVPADAEPLDSSLFAQVATGGA